MDTHREPPKTVGPPEFVALDFETANRRPQSACAVGVVLFVEGIPVTEVSRVLWVERESFEFSAVHGLTAEICRSGTAFRDVWIEVEPLVTRCRGRLVAHNAAFDRQVLAATARAARVRLPRLRYTCTRDLARTTWGVSPADLPSVCGMLGIDLVHHDPLSDARAAGLIAVAAFAEQARRREAAGGVG